MDEAAKYADMIEVPVNTCTITVKPAKKRRTKKKKTDEQIKEELLNKVNTVSESAEKVENAESADMENFFDEKIIYEAPEVPVDTQVVEETLNEPTVTPRRGFFGALFARRKKDKEITLKEAVENFPDENEVKTATDFKKEYEQAIGVEEVRSQEDLGVPTVNIRTESKKPLRKKRVLAEVGVVVVLIGAVIATTALAGGLGLNDYFAGVFAPSNTEDVKEYTEFDANLPVMATGAITLSEGVMTIVNEGSVYASADGVIRKVSNADGKFSIEIEHSEDFKTVINGLDYAYVNEGESVYGNIPVGYSRGEAFTVCLYSESGMITDFNIDTGKVVWADNVED